MTGVLSNNNNDVVNEFQPLSMLITPSVPLSMLITPSVGLHL